MKLKLLTLLLALSSLSLLLAVGRSEAVAEPTFGDMAVARVNGVEIGQMRLEHYFSDYLQAQGRMVGSIRNPVAYKRLRDAALDDLIDKELLWQEALTRKLEVDDASVEQSFAALRKEFTSDEVFNRRLDQAGFDRNSFTQYLRHELTSQRMLAELSQTPPATDSEVLAFYRTQPPRIRARHILLQLSENADAQTVDASREQLLSLRARILAGEDFASVANRYSEDTQAAEGGDLGYFSRDSMVPAFSHVAFSLPAGQVSEPVRSSYGWHLIRVETTVSEAGNADSQGLAQAHQLLDRQRQQQATTAALQRLRAVGKIERAGER